ncbi:MAG: ROK family transcriptional regulator [Anaerolineae bacterium]|nr:ROK family transcriptional regulator [Anaerolineae bacterium]
MRRPYTITSAEMRAINRSAIIEVIRLNSPISRTEIAHRLQLSLPTVMRIIDELTAEGWVRPHGGSEWSGGRRRSLLSFNAEAHAVIGIDLGGTKMYGAIADLAGTVIDELEFTRHGTTGDSTYERLAELIQTLLNSDKIGDRHMRGIGVGVPGITRHRTGVVEWAPSLNWRDYPLCEKLAARFALPIMIDNDLNFAALGELWFGAGENAQNMVLIAIGTGIGAGIIIDGSLYRGANEAAGEVGYLLPGRQFLNTRYDTFGALENVASGTGIAEQARQFLKGQRDQATLDALTSEDVFEAVRRGEAWARTVLDEVIDYLAILVGSISAYLDPEVIVIGGGVARAADLLIAPILKRIEGTVPTPPKLVASTLGTRATVSGAIANVLHNTSDYYVVHKLT